MSASRRPIRGQRGLDAVRDTVHDACTELRRQGVRVSRATCARLADAVATEVALHVDEELRLVLAANGLLVATEHYGGTL
jgi:hypothetical protein